MGETVFVGDTTLCCLKDYDDESTMLIKDYDDESTMLNKSLC